MSLAMVLANQHGIVMSADKRLTLTVTNIKNNESDSFVATDNEQKIFVTKTGHGIAYVGNSVLKDNACTSEVILETIRNMPSTHTALKEEIRYVMDKIVRHDDNAVVFTAIAGIENGKRHVFVLDSISNIIKEDTDALGNGYTYLGESKLASEIVNMVKHDHANLPLQDTINYLRFVNSTIAKIQYYGKINQTVSENCNILVIRNDGTTWVNSPDILN